MSRSRLLFLAAVMVFVTPVVLHACFWDYDTLKMERSRFPTTLELITGKFLRHSPEFYEWRVADRKSRLENEPDNLALYDDLAVAYSKLGQHKLAIETILLKEKKKPGLYETYANLGTFYIFAGEWEKSLEYLDKALVINPDAHFGRERYQKYLVEYILSRRRTAKLPIAAVGLPFLAAKPPSDTLRLPLCNSSADGESNNRGFYRFLCEKEPTAKTLEGRQAAVKGILGMMKFASYDLPLLLEALGDVLGSMYDQSDAKQLAARAYLQAAWHATTPDAQKDYRKLAAQVLKMQVGYDRSMGMKLSDLETSFQVELKNADAWYATLHNDELRWIREGKNPEAEFDKLYTADPIVASPDDEKISAPDQVIHRLLALLVGFVAIVVVFVVAVAALMIFMIRRSRRRAGQLVIHQNDTARLLAPSCAISDDRMHTLPESTDN